MTRSKISIFLIPILIGATLTLYTHNVKSVSSPDWISIDGLVGNPLNLTYTELKSFPYLSEVAKLWCAGSGTPPYGPSITYNWTGVPLFHLLSMAEVIPGDYREVVFIATDNFSSSIKLETAMEPTTILAFEANGTDLEEIEGFGSGYRIVIPCRWGYKWVKLVEQITIVDYDYKGTYEQGGYYSDEAIIPNCTMPSTNPPIQTFKTGRTNYSVEALSNYTIESFIFEGNTLFTFDIAGQGGNAGYFYLTFPEELLNEPYQVYVNHSPSFYNQTKADGKIYLLLSYLHNNSIIEVEGTDPQASNSTIVVSFHEDSNPKMLLYSPTQKIVWVALAGERRADKLKWNSELGIAAVNVTSHEYEVHVPPLPTAEVNRTGGFISMDYNYTLWTTIEYEKNGSTYRYLTYFDTNTLEWNITKIELTYSTVYFSNGFVWGFRCITVNSTYAYTQILKVNPETIRIVSEYNWTYQHNIEEPNIISVDDSLWFSTKFEDEYGIERKKLIKFNTTSNKEVFSVTSLDLPAGLEYKNGVIYVAELKEEPYVRETIALVDEETGDVLNRIVLAHITRGSETGVHALELDSNDNLWWIDKKGETTDNCSRVGAISCWLSKNFKSFGVNNEFIEEVENKIWFTSQGSAYIEELKKFRNPDVTEDGYVGIDDIVAVAEHFGTEDEEYDVTADGYVGVDDIVLTAEHFGEECQ